MQTQTHTHTKYEITPKKNWRCLRERGKEKCTHTMYGATTRNEGEERKRERNHTHQQH